MIKYNAITRSLIIELSALGYSMSAIADRVGVHRNTISNWIERDSRLKELISNRTNESLRESVLLGLHKLSKGAKNETITKEYIDYRKDKDGEYLLDDNDEKIPVKIKKSTTTLPPNVKAIEILARQHAKEYDKDIIETNSSIINIDTSGMSMREIQTMMSDSPLGANRLEESVSVDYEVLDEALDNVRLDEKLNDIDELESGVPPVKESESE